MKKTKEEKAEQCLERVYPLADENDYPENPNVNYHARGCRAAFMNGVRVAEAPLKKNKQLENLQEHLQILIDNKNAYIETIEKRLEKHEN